MPGLSEDDLDPDPMAQFRSWYGQAGTDAVTLVTASGDGAPAGRMVLLKGADDGGFTVFTNYGSAKARDLAANPRAALVFFWPPDRQVRVSGRVERVSEDETERYWRSRARASQIGAWASRQSEVIPGRDVLERRVAQLEERYAGRDVPCPPFWGGYRLVPEWVEFWHHREDRLHDRLRYRRQGRGWAVERLSP